jgi:X-Pro dipeptidyl-peptidase
MPTLLRLLAFATFVIQFSAACSAGPPVVVVEPTPPPAAPPTAAPGAGPVIVDGQAQVVPAFADSARWIRHDLWVETAFDSDGDGQPDRVHVAVTRPWQTEAEGLRVPVVYETSPYYSGTGSADLRYFWDVRHELDEAPPPRVPMPAAPYRSRRPRISNAHVAAWVPRGFAVVHSQSPGTGLSQGCPTVGGENEALAPKAVIDWLNGRARGFTAPVGGEEVVAHWSTGRVGMIGTSYSGTLPIAAATTGVAGLEAIVPIAPNTSYYHYYRSHGLVRSPGGYRGEDLDVLYDYINSGDPARRPYCDAAVRDGLMLPNLHRHTGDYSDFWAGRDYLYAIGNLRAAVLMAHAFNDWNVMPEHGVRVYEAARAGGTPAQLYMHQGGHGGAPPLELVNRWFTRYLHGVENGVEDDPRSWIVREGDDRLRPTPYADFPHPAATFVALRPTTGGRTAGGLVPLPAPAPQGLETLVDDVAHDGAALAAAAASHHRLLYATAPLAEPLHLSGTPRITVRVAASRPAANLSVWLVSLPWVPDAPRITDNVITRGWADPRNHRSLRQGEPLVPGRFYDVSFTLQPDDQVLPAGARIGLMIFSSDRDFTLWPSPGTELTVELDGTMLELPVVGGEPALRRALGR